MHSTNQITLPANAATILERLESAGHEAYVVGGCVRDSVLGRMPGDWDITTSALPREVKALFHRTVDTGLKHGTVTILMGREQYEVTTYRVDGEYEDGRHPKEVSFTRSLSEDLQRRDFTINAMAYNPKTGIVDLFGGLEDIRARVIRAVGDPVQRFTEDALRIMRAVRFSAQLDYAIADETRDAIRQMAPNLQKVSAERIRVELEKLLVSDHPERLRDAYALGVTAIFLPEFDRCMETQQHNPHHCYSVGDHILHSVCAVGTGGAACDYPGGAWDKAQLRILRLTMLLHDIAKPNCLTTDEKGIDHFHGHVEQSATLADSILRRLKYDNDTRKSVVQLVRYHDWKFGEDKRAVRRAIVRVGETLFPLLLEVKRADVAAQSTYRAVEKLLQISRWESLYREIVEEKDCLTLRDLAVSGQDLIAAGVQPGRQIGKLLSAMLEDVLEEPSHNNRTYLMETYL